MREEAKGEAGQEGVEEGLEELVPATPYPNKSSGQSPNPWQVASPAKREV